MSRPGSQGCLGRQERDGGFSEQQLDAICSRLCDVILPKIEEKLHPQFAKIDKIEQLLRQWHQRHEELLADISTASDEASSQAQDSSTESITEAEEMASPLPSETSDLDDLWSAPPGAVIDRLLLKTEDGGFNASPSSAAEPSPESTSVASGSEAMQESEKESLTSSVSMAVEEPMMDSIDLPASSTGEDGGSRRLIGEGTFGRVYQSTRSDGLEVAVKEIKLRDEVLQMHEVWTLQRLGSHPNIVRLLDFSVRGDAGGLQELTIVMEFCHCDLLALIRKGLAHAEVKNLSAQLLCGLAFAHRQAVVHKDLKPANILVTGQGTLKIADWGSSGRTKRCTTLWYRAPETLLLDGVADAPGIDVWASGALIYEMTTSRPLFPANSESQLVQMHKEFPAALQRLPTVAMSCLVKDKALRPSCAALLCHDFFLESPLSCTSSAIRLPGAGEVTHSLFLGLKRSLPESELYGSLFGSDPEHDAPSRPAKQARLECS